MNSRLISQFFAAFAKNAFGQIARRRFNIYGRGRARQGEAAKNFPGNMTRQQIRARLRAESLAEINSRFGPAYPGGTASEPRRLRRVLGLALARNRYRASTVGLRTPVTPSPKACHPEAVHSEGSAVSSKGASA